ncbi:jg27928 [Pararge aegeria aegeria]|uniref:Jg27928 protein n=1 Tax=Pararge aegeria aegeria TaxID=348720 RepID=A0A8S4R4M9_9NEOP|nr:jg27928 [Pararge aegeria aegeria]
MTEASENVPSLVRIRAQVMCRDEGTGGWVALGGGGLADIVVGRRGPVSSEVASELAPTSASASHTEFYIHGRRINDNVYSKLSDLSLMIVHFCPAVSSEVASELAPTSASASHTEFYIHGRRINDNVLVLDCTVKDDFQYHKVMPTFHHWVSDEKRFGLTFQTAADARAFDRGVRTAVTELYRLGGAWPTMYGYQDSNQHDGKEDDEEKHIFECLNLPSDSHSSSETSTASRVRRDDLTQTPILSAITLPQHPLSESMTLQYDDKLDDSDADKCPYVHLSAVHEYAYPQVGPDGVITSESSSPHTQPPLLRQDSGSLKKSSGHNLPDKHRSAETFHARIKCRHCHEWYLESANRAGACKFAPDCFKTCIDCVTCIKCAQCMLYHCMSDVEGEFVMQPCACGPPTKSCSKRWIGLTLLSFLVPCLWCYLPLRCVHRAARAVKLAGGEHSPQILK